MLVIKVEEESACCMYRLRLQVKKVSVDCRYYATYRFTICRIATSHSAMNIEMDSILVTWQSGTA